MKQLVALDCEMVKTEFGMELARVSIVDAYGRVIYDRLVRPSHPVIDYLTDYSGITKEMLRYCSISV